MLWKAFSHKSSVINLKPRPSDFINVLHNEENNDLLYYYSSTVQHVCGLVIQAYFEDFLCWLIKLYFLSVVQDAKS